MSAPRAPQPYDEAVLALLAQGGYGRVFGEYALAFVDYRMGNRPRRPSKKAYGMLPEPTGRLDKHLDRNL